MHQGLKVQDKGSPVFQNILSALFLGEIFHFREVSLSSWSLLIVWWWTANCNLWNHKELQGSGCVWCGTTHCVHHGLQVGQAESCTVTGSCRMAPGLRGGCRQAGKLCRSCSPSNPAISTASSYIEVFTADLGFDSNHLKISWDIVCYVQQWFSEPSLFMSTWKYISLDFHMVKWK